MFGFQVLGAPPAAGGGAVSITSLASGSLPAAATLDLTGIPATYRAIQLVLLGLSHDNGSSRNLQFQISVDNGSNWLATNYIGATHVSGTTTTLTTVLAQMANALAAASTANITLTMFNYQGSVYPQVILANSGGGLCLGGYIGGTSAVNGIRALWNGAGNFDAGTYALLGIT